MSDPGLSRERTRLAWFRTLLVAATVAVLAARMAATDGDPLLVALALAGWTALFAAVLGRDRVRRPGPTLPLFTVGYATLGALLVLTR